MYTQTRVCVIEQAVPGRLLMSLLCEQKVNKMRTSCTYKISQLSGVYSTVQPFILYYMHICVYSRQT